MSAGTSIVAGAAHSGVRNAQADLLLKQARASVAVDEHGSKEDARIAKAGKDFEAILLGSWLQKAEQSFATAPGEEGGTEDDDSGKEQFESFATQALAGSLTASGGIGIAKMISDHLRAAAFQESPAPEFPAQQEAAKAGAFSR